MSLGGLVRRLRRFQQSTGRLAGWALAWPGDRRLTRAQGLPPPYRRIYLVHVQKTGGTSLEQAFFGLGGEEPSLVEHRFVGQVTQRSGGVVLSISPQPFYIGHSEYFFARSHVPRWSYRLPDDVYAVSVLREPSARLLSYYHYLRDPAADAGHLLAAGRHERDWAADGIEAFVERLPPEKRLAQVWMFSESFDPQEAAERIRGLQRWFFTESFEAGRQALSIFIGRPLPTRRDRVSTSGAAPTAEQWALVRRGLAPEYQLMALLRADPGPGFVGSFPDFALRGTGG